MSAKGRIRGLLDV